MTLLKNERFLFFVGGIVATIVGGKALQSKVTHKLAVQGVAAGMKFQKNALEKFQNIKEEATDLNIEVSAETEE